MKRISTILCVIVGLSHGVAWGAECNADSGNAHWASLTKTSNAFGNILLEAQGRELTVSEQLQAEKWLKETLASAQQIDQVFGLSGANSASALVESFTFQNTTAGAWIADSEKLFGFGFDEARRRSGLPDELYLDGGSIPVELDTQAYSEQCAAVMACGAEKVNACRVYVDDWVSAVNAYKDAVFNGKSKIIYGLAVAYGNAWDTYFDEARSQTFLDRMVTARFNRDALKSNEFVLPPKYQYFFLHPSVLMEYVDKAADGNQFEAALAVEWFGINSWQSCFGSDFACGASLVSTYSDRAGVDDVGHGLMLHIDNSYSFGATTRDGDVGYFVTVDLLKLFEDKKTEVKAWQDRAQEVLGSQ
ncbi:hypothetical protein LRP49_14805 [Enterovibrio sp. ZSDZ35]|uniref:Uncharacterized protein n=1 Tax=Enterovibrio qingdaonensis TaxID=2899818 RepID=A0ABT5QN82_9GAMM|nr:hypothetical protein [Enterovibrio sp. ZSDZ35]MDD1782439.1 hypothetical protein [Enterovibrio sp. ZSDZ35]